MSFAQEAPWSAVAHDYNAVHTERFGSGRLHAMASSVCRGRVCTSKHVGYRAPYERFPGWRGRMSKLTRAFCTFAAPGEP